jgi:hypothetical protein
MKLARDVCHCCGRKKNLNDFKYCKYCDMAFEKGYKKGYEAHKKYMITLLGLDDREE